MELTKEKAIAYFNEKAPKSLREKGVSSIVEYALAKDELETTIFVINDTYMIRYIFPEAFNCFMRNQNFKPTLKGLRWSKKELTIALANWKDKGWLREIK